VQVLVWESTTRKEPRHLELTSKVTTEFAFKGTPSELHKRTILPND